MATYDRGHTRDGAKSRQCSESLDHVLYVLIFKEAGRSKMLAINPDPDERMFEQTPREARTTNLQGRRPTPQLPAEPRFIGNKGRTIAANVWRDGAHLTTTKYGWIVWYSNVLRTEARRTLEEGKRYNMGATPRQIPTDRRDDFVRRGILRRYSKLYDLAYNVTTLSNRMIIPLPGRPGVGKSWLWKADVLPLPPAKIHAVCEWSGRI